MSQPLPEDMAAASERAVKQFLSDLGSDFATGKYVLIVESFDTKGDRPVWVSSGIDMKSWDIIGLLRFALALEENAIGTGNGCDCE